MPCTRQLRPAEIESEYEVNTGKVIVERFTTLDPMQKPAVLVASHAPFVWGASVAKAVENALVLEYLARLASETLVANPSAGPMQAELLDKHSFASTALGLITGEVVGPPTGRERRCSADRASGGLRACCLGIPKCSVQDPVKFAFV